MKSELGSRSVALIDAHQPEYRDDGSLDLRASVWNVAASALAALGISRHILDHLAD
jgi:hypothetical protein